MTDALAGVIAAIITPLGSGGEPDHARLAQRALHLLNNGCDGLNLLGTTGEATSFSLAQRSAVMKAMAAANLPLDRMMVGTGAAALADARALTQLAADLGFAGALVLPPFYYKPVSADGLLRYLGALVEATAHSALPLYLYNFPALSGIAYTPGVVEALIGAFGARIAGLKDSSGDLDYATQIAALSPALKVFPSNEATLLRARAGDFAGCISATANLNFSDCALAFRQGDESALKRAAAVRAAFDGLPLVPAIKAALARLDGDDTLANLVAPLAPLTGEQDVELKRRLDAIGFFDRGAAA